MEMVNPLICVTKRTGDEHAEGDSCPINLGRDCPSELQEACANGHVEKRAASPNGSSPPHRRRLDDFRKAFDENSRRDADTSVMVSRACSSVENALKSLSSFLNTGDEKKSC